MNRALRIIFSRYGIVVIILVLVLGVIALANRRQETPLDGTNGVDGTDGAASSEAFTEDDGFATEDCTGDDCYAEEELPQEAVDRAVEFTAAWLNPGGSGQAAWFDSIEPYMTAETAEAMTGVDPETVPAEEISGEPAADGSKVSIPLDTGTLTLTMLEGANNWTENGWLVSAIDWEQS
ncbi:hypothetical protein [Glycomyces terrestris]|uniref:Uncharacterized protein n=1 Tax=Glycomyces terrestris TaxID=2493553 RepID=A0A426UY23_9ACTN|nr:hypothetical protein [Glycomyces terrestris]RRR99469.1 hypothetical protein EIW28_12240 [Glycomyces terrestris]